MMLLDNAVRADKSGRERQGWIDAMRGFAIFLVVVGHIEMFMLEPVEESVLVRIIYLFHIPLFFFISGYLSMNKADKMSWPEFGKSLLNSFRRLVLPAMIFFVLLNWIDPYYATLSSLPDKLYSGFFGGYWFTLVLFYILVVISVIRSLFRVGSPWFAIIVFAVLLLSLTSPLILSKLNIGLEHRCLKLLCVRMFIDNLQFYMFGVLCRRYNLRFDRILKRAGWAIISLFIIAVIVKMKIDSNTPLYVRVLFSFHSAVVKYLGILSCVVFFAAYRDYFQQRNKLSSFLVSCGKRSLDIYFIHYFLLGNMVALGSFFAGNDNTGLQILFYAVAAAAIIGLSLLFGQFLRSSDYLSYVLFGSKFPAIKR
ncbi:acyltransferase [uncultured Alistipes sp.]|uniref:acyltransferase family protein n=1 Tax=uncultured Alistipes sp. TaxID=538949 RepID=UPI0032B2359E